MFRLIKWLLILCLAGLIWYVVIFIKNMDDSQIDQVKKDAVDALDSGDPKVLIEPLTKNIREDLLMRKKNIIDRVKKKLKNAADNAIEEAL